MVKENGEYRQRQWQIDVVHALQISRQGHTRKNLWEKPTRDRRESERCRTMNIRHQKRRVRIGGEQDRERRRRIREEEQEQERRVRIREKKDDNTL